jgi:hypothetical protein
LPCLFFNRVFAGLFDFLTCTIISSPSEFIPSAQKQAQCHQLPNPRKGNTKAQNGYASILLIECRFVIQSTLDAQN